MQLKSYFEKTLFWDVNFEKLDVDKSAKWVVDRGTDLQQEKLIEYYGFDFVRETMLKARYIMPFGIYFVLVRLDIPLTDLRFYKWGKAMSIDSLYKKDDFHIDEYLCF